MAIGDRARPRIVVVIGVSGSGKSTLGGALAVALGWDFLEGDDLHPAANIAKMAAGQPLTDDDRRPWLEAISQWMSGQIASGRSGIVTCSALKRSYRDILRHSMIDHPEGVLTFMYLSGSRDRLEHRLATRTDHFMPPGLLDSQLDTLETPTADEEIITIEIGPPPSEIAATALAAIGGVPLLVVDAANVVGSRPDGWWRDRAGAARRLLLQLAAARKRLPSEVVVVLEGGAKSAVTGEQDPEFGGLRLVLAAGSGDDAIVDVVANAGNRRSITVVTADRGLRARIEALGATAAGPRQFLDEIES
ncbi:MAG: gntK [Nocardia sp.]|uniref:NYN domain-containing protein n=1 Tax=Nocardia sp. TaxID=1821 RepID=UPI003454326C|nr:gntK [Nocardia sp.]